MRVLYLQLPVPDFGYDYWGADHPLAGGYMAAYCIARGLRHEPIFLPRGLTSFGSTPALVQGILEADPDVVVATLYLWNVERVFRVLKPLKKEKPSVLLLAGGPDTAGDFSRRFPHHPFDLVLPGEGEELLWSILLDVRDPSKRGLRAKKKVASKSSLDLAHMTSPYLMGLLGLAPDGSLWLETMRGCPYRCAYCYYGKSLRRLRWFPEEWIETHMRWANKMGAREVYFLDPSFQVYPQLKERLKKIALWNQGPVPLHTEARVEGMDSTLADLFVVAGFRSLEVGLQAVNAQALRKAGRKGDPDAFAKGAHLLLERGIKLQIDVIMGLPGDGLEGFLKTLEFLRREGLAEWVTVFPLLVLPGTRLREKASSWGIDFDPRPPYQIRRVGALDLEAMRSGLEEAERILGTGLYPLHLPDFATEGASQGGLVGLIEIKGGALGETGFPGKLLQRLAQAPVFLFREGERGPIWEEVRTWARWQRETVPDLTPFWVIEANNPFPTERLTALLAELHDPTSYQGRVWDLAPDPYLRMSCRPFILSRCNGPPMFWLELHQHLVPVIRVTTVPPFLESEDPLKGLPVLWDTPQRVSWRILKTLAQRFQGREEELLFSTRSNMNAWATIVGLEMPTTRPPLEKLVVP